MLEQTRGFVPVTSAELRFAARQFRSLFRPELVLFAEVGGVPAGIVLAMPDFNQALARVPDGRLLPVRVAAHRARAAARSISCACWRSASGPPTGGAGSSCCSAWSCARRRGASATAAASCRWSGRTTSAIHRTIAAMGGRRTKTYRIYEGSLSMTPALNPTIKAMLARSGADRDVRPRRRARVCTTARAGSTSTAGRNTACWRWDTTRRPSWPPCATRWPRATPAFLQPYRAPHAEALAEELVRRAPAGIARCVFTNSGAETVEAAIKLTRAATGRTGVLSAEGGYHGSTYAAMAASGQPDYRDGFGPLPAGFDTVPYGDADALDARLARDGAQTAAFIVEPIQGRRGAHAPPPGYLARARAACTRHGVALVADEIQTGLGRTGTLFACEREAVAPDVLLVAKALGGGLFPLGACLASERLWSDDFALRHLSTFANNNLACLAGIVTLRELDALLPALPDKAAACTPRCVDLAARHPASSARCGRTACSPRSSSHPPRPGTRARRSPPSNSGASTPRRWRRRSRSGRRCWCSPPSAKRTSSASSRR